MYSAFHVEVTSQESELGQKKSTKILLLLTQICSTRVSTFSGSEVYMIFF